MLLRNYTIVHGVEIAELLYVLYAMIPIMSISQKVHANALKVDI
jgi:hypothetical protein